MGYNWQNLILAKAMSGLVRMPNQATLPTSSPNADFSGEETV
jgi:hypothetical protein